MPLRSKRILLGITGGIAAYKTPELVRQLRSAGADVQVVLSRGATRFVTATTLQAVSERPVRDDLWDEAAEAAMGHIELARWADAVLIAPSTAHCMAKLATGQADDLLTTLCLATDAPVALAPAMNQQMWRQPATRRNLETLIGDGFLIFGPGEGDQACGDTGPGRMLEPAELVTEVQAIFLQPVLAGCHVLITAGPTREALDPVRYISNHSSGRQGFALAQAARDAGATVTLVAGPVSLSTPRGVERVDVVNAEEMHEAVSKRSAGADIFIGVAAVADYRPEETRAGKIKKRGDNEPMSMLLVQNPDVIASVATRRGTAGSPFIVGFAAETDDGPANAREKLLRKGLDLIVLNDVSNAEIGFDSKDNAVTLIGRAFEETVPKSAKTQIARTLIQRIAELYQQSRPPLPRAGTEPTAP